jgi:hypothetical protein
MTRKGKGGVLIKPELRIGAVHNMIRGGRELYVWILGGLCHQGCSEGKAIAFDRSKVADETRKCNKIGDGNSGIEDQMSV